MINIQQAKTTSLRETVKLYNILQALEVAAFSSLVLFEFLVVK
jgi:hypothetical protein